MPTAKSTNFSALKEQRFDEHGPGTVVRDFETLLDFIGPDGLRATGKHHSLPLDGLVQLDGRMSRPLRPNSKRPQLRSFPVLQSLNMLLRATGLGVPQGKGRSSGRLVLDAEVLSSWRTLNTTEKYFTLFDAWMFNASLETIGERGDCGQQARSTWYQLRSGVHRETDNALLGTLNYYSSADHGTLAFFELFGLGTFERLETSNLSRRLKFSLSPFGVQLMDLVVENIPSEWEDRIPITPEFEVLQPLLQEYFPEWKSSLQIKEPEFRSGVFQFKVSWGRIWRQIAIGASSTLDELAGSILEAVEFEDDHLYEFQLRTRTGRSFAIVHPCIENADYWTDEFAIGDLPLAEGESMTFLFDFGDEWLFDVKFESVDPSRPDDFDACITASHGKSPPQYPYDDDDEYDDEDEEFDEDDEQE